MAVSDHFLQQYLRNDEVVFQGHREHRKKTPNSELELPVQPHMSDAIGGISEFSPQKGTICPQVAYYLLEAPKQYEA